MDPEELLRRLALSDEQAIRDAVSASISPLGDHVLDTKTTALARIAALLSVGAPTAACRATVDVARATGARDIEIVAVLVAVAPVIGTAGIVRAAPRLALALDYDAMEVADACADP